MLSDRVRASRKPGITGYAVQERLPGSIYPEMPAFATKCAAVRELSERSLPKFRPVPAGRSARRIFLCRVLGNLRRRGGLPRRLLRPLSCRRRNLDGELCGQAWDPRPRRVGRQACQRSFRCEPALGTPRQESACHAHAAEIRPANRSTRDQVRNAAFRRSPPSNHGLSPPTHWGSPPKIAKAATRVTVVHCQKYACRPRA